MFVAAGQRTSLFQSTPPCGGDHGPCPSGRSRKKFQSTPPCGGDMLTENISCINIISIHAPLRGRHAITRTSMGLLLFQSTPPCGGDFSVHFCVTTLPIFQSTPPCGGDVLQVFNCACFPAFQSTPPCGGDLPPVMANAPSRISIHAPLRGRLCLMPTAMEPPNFNPRPLAGATVLLGGD